MDIRKREIHTFYILTQKQSLVIVGCIVGIVIGLVLAGMNILQLKEVPKPILEYTPHFLGFALFFAMAATIYYFVKRFEITVIKKGDDISVTVYDPNFQEPLELKSPFILKRQWSLTETSRGQKIRSFCICIFNAKHERVISLEGGIGKWNDVPKNFKFVGSPGAIEKGKYRYATRKLKEISEILPQ